MSEEVLRKQRIAKAVDLKQGQWLFFYQNSGRRNNYQAANNVYENFTKANDRLGIKVEEPEFIELENEGDKEEIEQAILNFMMANNKSTFRHPICAIFVLGNERNYPAVKEVCT